MSTSIIPVRIMTTLSLDRHAHTCRAFHSQDVLPWTGSKQTPSSFLPSGVRRSVSSSSHSHRRPLIIRSSMGGIPSSGGSDKPPLSAMLRIFAAVKNIQYLETIASEMPRRLMPVIETLDGKKQAVTMVAVLLGLMTKNVQFLIRPNSDNGVDLGFMLTLVWQKTFTPFGKGISFFTHQVYEGKFYVRNLEALKKPLAGLQQKLADVSAPVFNKISDWTAVEQGQIKSAFLYILISVSIITLSFILLKHL